MPPAISTAPPRAAVIAAAGRCSSCRPVRAEAGRRRCCIASAYGTDGGEFPTPSLIFDAAGNLYGTTCDGGTFGGGTVFELTPAGGGTWTEQVLYSFGNGMDGIYPQAGLIFDAAGNLYGTTYEGGVFGYGTVFELTPAGGGTWTEKVLHSFGNGDGRVVSLGRADLRCRRQSLRHHLTGRHRHFRRDSVRVDARSGRDLDGEGAVELRQWHGRGRSPSRADLRCRRQSLRHDQPWRHFQQRNSIRDHTSYCAAVCPAAFAVSCG